MDVQEFQLKLTELCKMAEENDKVLTGPQVREFFAGMELDKGQLLKILQYLKVQGITIEGLEISSEENGAEDSSGKEEAPEKKIVPLTPEEQAYLREYRAGLGDTSRWEKRSEELFRELADESEEARMALTELYLPVAAQIAVEMNCEEIFLADLIQEANVSLLDALNRPEPEQKDDLWLRREIRRGITQVIEEQTEQKLHDDSLVARVEKLDHAIRELSEDEEDGESKFSVNELAIILDMDVEEMKDVLRLTGDDK
ncbi:MAG: hypothetical protein Q4C77_06560 [Eubacteriales bacterium]|nr:hypothetical protein [Eubacteriales bacterium]